MIMKTRKFKLIVILLLTIILFPWKAKAVEDTTVALIGDTEYSSLQSAINNVSDGETIYLLKDVKENIYSKSKSYHLDLQGHTIDGNQKNYVYYINGGSVEIINGTITGGKNTYGGGFYLDGTNLTITNVTIENNEALYGGGGIIAFNNSIINANEVTIKNNKSTSSYYGGGAIFLWYESTINITDSIISDNSAEVEGGAIYTKPKGTYKITITNTEITNNYTTDEDGTGGAIAIYGTANLTIDNSNISYNSVSTKYGKGGGIYADGGSVVITNSTLNNNSAGDGGAIYSDVGLEIKGSTFDSNKTSGKASAIYFNDSSTIINTSFTNNTGMSTLVYTMSGTECTFSNVQIKNNTATGEFHAPIQLAGGTINFINSTITDNIGWHTGAIYMNGGTLNLDNTIIKNNQATGTKKESAGGISLSSGTINFNSGAIYNNQTASSYQANDIYINSKMTMIAAKDMSDGDYNFNGYYFIDYSNNVTYEEKIENNLTAIKYLTASNSTADMNVAEIDNKGTFSNLNTAVSQAEETDTIHLIADEEELKNTVFSNNIYIVDDTTIDLNGRTIASNTSQSFTIESDQTLYLIGEGIIDNKIVVNDTGKLDVNAKLNNLVVSLGEGSYIILGSDFNTQAIDISFNKDFLNKINNSANTIKDSVLIYNINDFIYTINGINNDLIVIEIIDNNVVLHKKVLDGIFIDGINGNDNNSGTIDSPVKTFEKAKELLINNDKSNIYVTGTITINDTQEWDLNGKNLMRFPDYTDKLINIGSNGSLTLSNILIDGASTKGKNNYNSLIVVQSGGKLIVNDGTTLQNNYIYGYISMTLGGAIHNNGSVTINGGAIQNCSALYGGAIYVGSSGELTINNGLITDNIAQTTLQLGQSSNKPSGGAILVGYDGILYLNGGTISSNTSYGNGGAITLGGNTAMLNSGTPTLVMTGGTIDSNTARSAGGGIYIECNSEAFISKGNITNNTAEGANLNASIFSNYAGGGIYINGGRDGYLDGILYLTNAIITDNTSDGQGGGLAGCPTASVTINVFDGAAIYENDATGAEDIYISEGNENSDISRDLYVSEYLLGGGVNKYVYASGSALLGEEIPIYSLHHLLSLIAKNNLTSQDTAIINALQYATVYITGNHSLTNGGGIGTNGNLIIGTAPTSVIDISVNKVWENDDEELRPEKIEVWLVRNDEYLYSLVITPDDQGNWEELVFIEQPETDQDGNKYTYTVVESLENLNKNYQNSVIKNDNQFTIINTYVIPEEPIGDVIITPVPITEEIEPNIIDNPHTGDSLTQYIVLLGLSSLSLITLLMKKRYIK